MTNILVPVRLEKKQDTVKVPAPLDLAKTSFCDKINNTENTICHVGKIRVQIAKSLNILPPNYNIMMLKFTEV